MKRSHLKHGVAAAALALASAMSAQATVIDFEDAAPALGLPSFSSGGHDFASTGAGFSGIDSADAFVFGNAPANSSGQFLFALNGDGLTMSQGGANFNLMGFDASFVAPLGGLGAGVVAGRLHIEGNTGNGLIAEDFDFSASDAQGNYNFTSFTASAQFNWVSSVTFTACVYDAQGGCDFAALAVPPQFGLDNLRVPESGTVSLALLGLGLLVARRRRAV